MRVATLVIGFAALAAAGCASPPVNKLAQPGKEPDPPPADLPPPEGGVRQFKADVPTVTTVMLDRLKNPRDPTKPAAILDGAVFRVTVTTPGSPPVEDRLSFVSGHLELTLGQDNGCPRAAYIAQSPEEGSVSFTAQCGDAKQRTDWYGVIRDTGITGTMVRAGPDGTAPVRSTFTGSRVR